VWGWASDDTIDMTIEHADGEWHLDGAVVDGLEGCLDLDLGFTPATNLTQLRRLALDVGASADVPVAWLDVDSWSLQRLPQRYERRTPRAYAYQSPTFGYDAVLDVSPDGFVTRYPGLWELEGIDGH
jgi:hypothetical protein